MYDFLLSISSHSFSNMVEFWICVTLDEPLYPFTVLVLLGQPYCLKNKLITKFSQVATLSNVYELWFTKGLTLLCLLLLLLLLQSQFLHYSLSSLSFNKPKILCRIETNHNAINNNKPRFNPFQCLINSIPSE